MVILKKIKKIKYGSRVIISIRPGRFLVAHGDQLLAILSPERDILCLKINYNLFQMHKFGTQFFCQHGPLFLETHWVPLQGSVFVNPSANTNFILCI